MKKGLFLSNSVVGITMKPIENPRIEAGMSSDLIISRIYSGRKF